jgi:hypothetical protein
MVSDSHPHHVRTGKATPMPTSICQKGKIRLSKRQTDSVCNGIYGNGPLVPFSLPSGNAEYVDRYSELLIAGWAERN